MTGEEHRVVFHSVAEAKPGVDHTEGEDGVSDCHRLDTRADNGLRTASRPATVLSALMGAS